MKRLPFGFVAGALIAGIVGLSLIAIALALAIADRERTPAPGPGAPDLTQPQPASAQPPASVPPTVMVPSLTIAPPEAATAISTPPVPADHAAFDPATQPCQSCHDPRGH